MKQLIPFLFLSTILFAQPSHEQEELSAENEQITRFDQPIPEEPVNPIVMDVYFYAAVDGGLVYAAGPSLGTSMRMQKEHNSLEVDLSVFPYHPLDLSAGLSYKSSFSYLYHFKNKGSSLYVGGGPGIIANRRAARPLVVTWLGYQFNSQLTKQAHLSGFIDGGITSRLERDRQAIILTPALRGGIGVSF